MATENFGKFTLLDHLGKGGMATVYRACNNEDGSIVAIKIFKATEERPGEIVRKLRDREVRVLQVVQSPCLVGYYAKGHVEQDYYYTMEFVEHSLQEEMKEGDELSLLEKVHVLRQTTEALRSLHHQGIVHRDVKPGNILLERDPDGALNVKLTDLGIAKILTEADVVQEKSPATVAGTHKYLSPEQIERRPIDGRSDIFSLGVVAYELLGNQSPFKADSKDDYLEANLVQEPGPLGEVNPEVPAFLVLVVEKMLAKERDERYDSVSLADDLALVEEHLRSGAPLVDEKNPDSLFFAPVREATAEREAGREPLRISWVSWIVVACLTLSGAVVAYAFWLLAPTGWEEKSPMGRSPTAPSPAVALADALRFADQRQFWRSYALIEGLAGVELSSEQKEELAELKGRLDVALAEPLYGMARECAEANALHEADAALARARSLFPDDKRAAAVARLIEQKKRELRALEAFGADVAAVNELVAKNDFRGALQRCETLTADYAQRLDLAQNARELAARIFDRWAEWLLRKQAKAPQIEDYLRAVAEGEGRGSPTPPVSLYFRLAELYENKGDDEKAAGVYDRIIRDWRGPAAGRAREKKQRVEEQMMGRPLSLTAFIQEVAEKGFLSPVWRHGAESDGPVEVSESAFTLRMQGGPREERNVLETRPALQHSGFSAGVEFRVSGEPAGAARFELGMEVVDADGEMVSLSFNGRRYFAAKARGGGRIFGGRAVMPALGDETRGWRALGMSYDFSRERMILLLDGDQVESYSARIGDFRLRFFLTIRGEGEAAVTFRNFACRAEGEQ